ncbi:MAG: hypothetical protein ACNA7Y_06130 [Gammaproteobacteria bacterium]
MKKIKNISALIAGTILSLAAASAHAQPPLSQGGIDPISKKAVYACPTDGGKQFREVVLERASKQATCMYSNHSDIVYINRTGQPYLPYLVHPYWRSTNNNTHFICGIRTGTGDSQQCLFSDETLSKKA